MSIFKSKPKPVPTYMAPKQYVRPITPRSQTPWGYSMILDLIPPESLNSRSSLASASLWSVGRVLYGENLMYVVEHALNARARAELVMNNMRFVETLREGTEAVLQKYTHRDIVDRLQFTRSAWDDNGCTDLGVSQILQWHAITDYAIADIDSVISRLGGVSPLHYSYSYIKTLEKIVERLESVCQGEGAKIQITSLHFTSLPCRDRTIACVNVLRRVLRVRPLPTIVQVRESIQADYRAARDVMQTVLTIARMQHRPSASGYVYLPNFDIIGC